MARLRLALQLQQPQLLASELSAVLLALPLTGQLHIITPYMELQQTPPELASNPSPVQVIVWDPSMPWRVPARTSQLG